MGSLNKILLIGRVGKDPEIRKLGDSGKSVANFSLATSERWKDKTTGERMERTEWHNIVVFSEGLVNVVSSYIKKGSKLYIEGKIQTRTYEDQQDTTRYITEVVLQGFNCNLTMLDSRDDASSPANMGRKRFTPNTLQDATDMDDSIPF